MTALGWQLVTDVDEQNPNLGDLRIVGSRFARLVTFGDSVAQACTVRLRWWLDEWFLDRSRGVPYIRDLLKKGVSEATVRAILRKELLAVEGVAQVASMTIAIDRRTRVARVTDVVVVTTEGERRSVVGPSSVRF